MQFRASLAVGVLVASSVAFGVAGLGTVDSTTDDTIDAYKQRTGDVIDTTELGTQTAGYDTNRANGMEAVVELETGPTTDVQFQRRTEEVDGETVTRDLAFVGISQIGGAEHGLKILDVTDPTDPVVLSSVDCGAFHNDIAVWQQYVVIGSDSGSSVGDGCAGDATKAGNGIYVFDASDPSAPELVADFSGVNPDEVAELTTGTHNIAIHPEGYLYFATAGFDATEPDFGIVNLDDLAAGATMLAMNGISPAATDGCHDLGFDFTGETPLLACPAIESTFIWDISEPFDPQEVATIANPAVNIHHGGRFTPDGSTMVLGDELAGAAGGSAGGTGGKSGLPIGALSLYDVSTIASEAPVLTGYASASEGIDEQAPGAAGTVTSHFYNFVPNAEDTTKVVTGWYQSGMVVHDLTGQMDTPVVGAAPEVAHLEPTEAEMWNAYAYRGYVFGNSYEGNTGFFVASLDGYTDTADAELQPYCNDVGIVWGPWTDDWTSECRNPGDPIPSEDGAGDEASGDELPEQADDRADENRSRRGPDS